MRFVNFTPQAIELLRQGETVIIDLGDFLCEVRRADDQDFFILFGDEVIAT